MYLGNLTTYYRYPPPPP
ncbi:hypothetical protein CPC1998_0628A, partial [Chlamydia psittaci C19/98]